MIRSLFLIALLSGPVPADYQQCVTIHNGPITPQGNYGIQYQRRRDNA